MAEDKVPENVMLTRLDDLVAWGRKYSLWPMPFGTACCAIEFMGTVSSEYDLSRFGAELVRFSPRQADMMLVMGTITYKMGPILQRIYNQMCEPKWVVAVGACASCGGFYENYHVVQGIDQIIPCDVYVAGCPPRPENILEAVVKMQKLVEREGRVRPERPIVVEAAKTFTQILPPKRAPRAGGNTRTSFEGPDSQVQTLIAHEAAMKRPDAPPEKPDQDLFASWTV